MQPRRDRAQNEARLLLHREEDAAVEAAVGGLDESAQERGEKDERATDDEDDKADAEAEALGGLVARAQPLEVARHRARLRLHGCLERLLGRRSRRWLRQWRRAHSLG